MKPCECGYPLETGFLADESCPMCGKDTEAGKQAVSLRKGAVQGRRISMRQFVLALHGDKTKEELLELLIQRYEGDDE